MLALKIFLIDENIKNLIHAREFKQHFKLMVEGAEIELRTGIPDFFTGKYERTQARAIHKSDMAKVNKHHRCLLCTVDDLPPKLGCLVNIENVGGRNHRDVWGHRR